MSYKQNKPLFKIENGKTLAFNPEKNEYIPVNDVREETKRASQEYPPTKEEKQLFYQQKIKRVESLEIPYEQKKDLLDELEEAAQEEEEEDPPIPKPIPGGVGFGIFFRDEALEFTNSSTLFYHIVTIPTIGAISNEYLYLTSTNRAPKGIEALISYVRQDKPKFHIYDWSIKKKKDRWAASKPYDLLDRYLIKHTSAGQEFDTIYVANSTRRLEGTRWRNEVLLRTTTGEYDFVYSHDYDLSASDERRFLTWGPIVETFPPHPNETNQIGFFQTKLLQDDGDALLLTDVDTKLRIDDPGFQLDLLEPNHSFIVH
jgi:hypothetical protein